MKRHSLFVDSYIFAGKLSLLSVSDSVREWVSENTGEHDPEVYLTSGGDDDIYVVDKVENCFVCQHDIAPDPFLCFEREGRDYLLHPLCALQFGTALMSEIGALDLYGDIAITVKPLKKKGGQK